MAKQPNLRKVCKKLKALYKKDKKEEEKAKNRLRRSKAEIWQSGVGKEEGRSRWQPAKPPPGRFED